MDLLDTIGQAGTAFDKVAGGRALRGLAAGKPRELASVVPYSDSMGLTNEKDATSGRDLTDMYGATTKGSNSFGSHAAGFLADNLLSPLNLAGGVGAFRAAPTIAKGITAGAKSLSGLDLLDHIGSGAKAVGSWAKGTAGALNDGSLASRVGSAGKNFLGDDTGSLNLKFDHHTTPPKGMLRSDPDWINNRTAYHGTASPNITGASIDPRKTDIGGLFGRGIYTTDSPKLARTYGDARLPNARNQYQNTIFAEGNTRKLLANGSFTPDLLEQMFNHNGAHVPDASRFKSEVPWIMNVLAPQITGGPLHPDKSELGRKLVDLYGNQFGSQGFPKKTMYQAQSNYGNILDLETQMDPAGTSKLRDSLMPVAEQADTHAFQSNPGLSVAGQNHFKTKLAAEGGVPQHLIRIAREANNDMPYAQPDALIQALKGAGYDAMTHQGGTRVGAGKLLHQVTIGLDPNNNYGFGRKTPYSLWEAMKHFGGDESGYLRHRIPGVSDEIHNAMDGLGPQYPGGTDKLKDIFATAAQQAEGSTKYQGMGDLNDRLNLMLKGPHAEGVASEMPQGTKFLGSGMEGMAFKTPDGGVIRVGDHPGQATRPDMPEMLQAYREHQVGPYKIEHMPPVSPMMHEFEGSIANKAGGEYSDDLAQAIARNNHLDTLNDRAGAAMRDRLTPQGVEPWDVNQFNMGATKEGKHIVFDGGAIAGKSIDPRFAEKPSYDAPAGDLLSQVMAAGGPEKVRESLRQGMALGTQGQGVDLPQTDEIMRYRNFIQQYLASSVPQATRHAGEAPSLGKLAGVGAGSLGAAGLIGALMAHQQQNN